MENEQKEPKYRMKIKELTDLINILNAGTVKRV